MASSFLWLCSHHSSAGQIRNPMGENGYISPLWPASLSTFGWLFWQSIHCTVSDFWLIRDHARIWVQQKSTVRYQGPCLLNLPHWCLGKHYLNFMTACLMYVQVACSLLVTCWLFSSPSLWWSFAVLDQSFADLCWVNFFKLFAKVGFLEAHPDSYLWDFVPWQ